MPERFLRSGIENDLISFVSPEDTLRALEGADGYLPFATEVSSVPAESRVVMYNEPRSPGADRFRWAGIRLRSLQAAKGVKTLLITSPLPGDGKSTVALNLATALSEQGTRPVLLLEADVYRPTLVKKLGLKPWAGLTECHKLGRDPIQAIRRIDPLGFYMLPAGEPREGDLRSILSSGIATLLREALSSSFFSWILVDSPPTIPVSEILILKGHSDGTLLVARAGATPRQAIEESARNLGRDHVVGIILNGVEGLNRTYSRYYGYGKSELRSW